MTLVKIDIKNIASETHPDDKVVFSPPHVRERPDGGLVSTAETVVSLVDGVGQVELVPGPVNVTFQCRGISDTRPKPGTVPDDGTVGIAEVIEGGLTFTPPVVNRALDMIQAERDHLLDDMATTVSEAVDGELGTAVRTAQTAAQTAAQAATSADGRATSAESAVNAYTPRVVALEALGGLSPESPVDGQQANLIAQPDTLTRQALEFAAADIDFKRKRIVSVMDYGAVADANYNGGTDNSDAFEAAYMATPSGGTLYVPPGNYWLSRTFKINRDIRFWCDWTSTSGGGRGASNLFFPPGINGIEIGVHGDGVVRYMGWEIGPFQVVTSSVSGTGVKTNSEGIGVYIKNGGKGTLHRTRVEGFGSHGILAKAYSPEGDPFKGNVNHLSLWEVTCTRNGGDGIQLDGTDVQRVTMMMPDTVGNHGWGINVNNAHSNTIIAPHAAQNYYDSLGAFRDNAISTLWLHVYSEMGKRMLFDTNSTHATLMSSLYGKPAIEFAGTSAPLTTLMLDPQNGFYGQVKVQGRQTWNAEMRMGSLADETLDIGLRGVVSGTPAIQTLLSAKAGNTDMALYRTIRPNAAGLDLGATWMKWQDGHFSRYVRAAGAIQTGAYGTANRPTPASVGVGGMIYDSDLKKIIVSTGTAWVDAMGAAV